jgi:hypothetical protein
MVETADGMVIYNGSTGKILKNKPFLKNEKGCLF